MTTPSREEAPELKVCPFCGSDEISHGESYPGFNEECRGIVQCHNCDAYMLGAFESDAIKQWNTRADLANREPSEVDVARIGRAVWAALSDEPLDDLECQREMEKAGLAAINAWRNP